MSALRSFSTLAAKLAVTGAVASVVLLVAIGGQGSAPGCALVASGSIIESQKYTPYEDRLTQIPNRSLIVQPGSTASSAAPESATFKVTSLGALPRQHTIGQADGAVYAYFLGGTIEGMTRPDFIRAGGIQLSQEPRFGSDAFSDYLLIVFKDRAVPIQIGTFSGALTWGDPDVNGIRSHNAYWSDGSFNYALSANRPAADVMNIARSLVCGP